MDGFTKRLKTRGYFSKPIEKFYISIEKFYFTFVLFCAIIKSSADKNKPHGALKSYAKVNGSNARSNE